MAKIQPLEQPKKLFILKLFLVLGFIAVPIVFSQVLKRNDKNILGTEIKNIVDIPEDTKPIAEEIQEKTNEITKSAGQIVQDAVESVLGEATNVVSNVASKSADALTEFVFQNTVAPLIKQIEKLPEKQKEEVKKAVCF